MKGPRASEHWTTLRDGTRIFYRAWEPAASPSKALILFHRGHEHSGRFSELVESLALEDTACFAWDARGHGRSPGDRGHAESFGQLVRDADEFARHLSAEHGIALEDAAVLGYSVGAALAAAWVHDYAPPVRAMVLAVPAFRVKLYVPLALPLLRLRRALSGKSFLRSYVKSRMLTHDPEQARLYDEDPLISRAVAVNVLIDLFDASRRLLADAGAIRVPTLVLSAGSDWVVRLSAQREFFEALGSPVKAMEVYGGFHHAIFHERDRRRPILRTRQFLEEAFRRPREGEALLRADREGHTKEEYDRLSRPLPALSLRRLRYAAAAALLRTIGRWSRGIRLGWRAGFDSGESLDYVYENRARGWTPLGRWIDRAYLDSPGWVGIRRRKRHLEETLRTAIGIAGSRRSPVNLLDVASGPGRYLLETLAELPRDGVRARLRDRDPRCLEAGRALARQMGLTGVVFEEGDAFDPASIAAVSPRADVAVVSGLYELFPENEKVLASLRGLHDAAAEGGLLVYTNQPWHPQLEFIARVLVNREGRPWVMRRRTQAEMDALVRAAGFEKIDMRIDDGGIFTVSLARRKAGP